MELNPVYKICPKCKEELEVNSNNFGIDNYRKDKFSIYCRPCHRINSRKTEASPAVKAWRLSCRQKARKYLLNWYKEQGGCPCGEQRPACLQADHLDAKQKKDNIGNMITRGMAISRIQKELDKCQVLCANCHAIKTSIQFNWYGNIEEEEKDNG